MFGNVLRRLTLGALLVVSVAALATATGGSAGLNIVSPYSGISHNGVGVVCNSAQAFNINERHYCLVVTTYNNLKKSGGVEVDLKIQNYDQSALTSPKATLTWSPAAALSFVSSDTSTCLPAQPAGVTCSFPNIPGVGSASGPGATPNESTVKVFFRSSAGSDVTAVNFTGTATAKESGNDNPGAANAESQTVDQSLDPKAGVMTYGTDASNDATIALPGGGAELDATAPRAASVKFNGGSRPFLAQFKANQLDPKTPGVCFPGINCTGLELTTDLSAAPSGTFSTATDHQILWTAEVAANNTNVIAVHEYDAVPITAAMPKTLTTAGTSFANCDGVTFTSAPAGLSTGVDYFVRNATTSGSGSSASTSFQVSTSAKGSIVSFTASGSFSGSCIRVIGDVRAERLTGCTIDAPPSPPNVPPGICAAKIDNSTVKVYLWDSANGGVHI